MSWVAYLVVEFVLAVCAHRLTVGRERRAARRNAANKSRATLLLLFNGLYPLPANWPIDIDHVLRGVFPAFQSGVAEFRPFVPVWRRWAFDRARFRYRCGTSWEIDLQNYRHYIAFGSNPKAKVNFKRNVDKLLSFAHE
jgi:hypothetical protein